MKMKTSVKEEKCLNEISIGDSSENHSRGSCLQGQEGAMARQGLPEDAAQLPTEALWGRLLRERNAFWSLTLFLC